MEVAVDALAAEKAPCHHIGPQALLQLLSRCIRKAVEEGAHFDQGPPTGPPPLPPVPASAVVAFDRGSLVIHMRC